MAGRLPPSYPIPSVRSLLHARAREKSKPGERSDNFHLSLVVECGGMRGVAAGGFLAALSSAVDCFDTLHGSSSGACAAAYFLSEQVEDGLQMYYEDLCHRHVVNRRRFLWQPSMVNTDYIVDEIFSKKRRLDTTKILSSRGTLNIVTTCIPSGSPVVHKNFSSADELLRALKATLRVPGPFERGIEIASKRHLDGGIVAPVPVFSAIESGATHILTVCTKRAGDYELPNPYRTLEGFMLRVLYGRELENAYLGNGSSSAGRIEVSPPPVIETLMRPRTGVWCDWHTTEVSVLHRVVDEATAVARDYFKQGQ
jgi:predicted patatin/cPLA2 family phospholipase